MVPAAPRNNQVDQLFRAQLFHDRKQYEERRRMSPEDRAKAAPVDYLMLSCAALWVGPVGGLGDGTGLNLNQFGREILATQSDHNYKDA